MEFKKIELNNGPPVQAATKTQDLGSSKRRIKVRFPKLKFGKKTGIILVALVGIPLILLVVLGVAVGIPARQIYADAKTAQDQLQVTNVAIKTQNLKNAKESLKVSKDKLIVLNTSVSKLDWFGSLPVVGAYQKDLKSLVTAGIAGVEGGQIAVEAIEPYADL